jgi:hypothetical protein
VIEEVLEGVLFEVEAGIGYLVTDETVRGGETVTPKMSQRRAPLGSKVMRRLGLGRLTRQSKMINQAGAGMRRPCSWLRWDMGKFATYIKAGTEPSSSSVTIVSRTSRRGSGSRVAFLPSGNFLFDSRLSLPIQGRALSFGASFSTLAL